jgi:hypothetical protein
MRTAITRQIVLVRALVDEPERPADLEHLRKSAVVTVAPILASDARTVPQGGYSASVRDQIQRALRELERLGA